MFQENNVATLKILARLTKEFAPVTHNVGLDLPAIQQHIIVIWVSFYQRYQQNHLK